VVVSSSSFNLFRYWPLSLFSLFFAAIIFLYVVTDIAPETLAWLTDNILDSLLLGLLLAIPLSQLMAEPSRLNSMFWLLLATSLCSWLIVNVISRALLGSLNDANYFMLNNSGYFLFYALMTAAIEIKNYNHAEQILTKQSLVIWVSTLSFALGSFSYLVLIPIAELEYQEHIWRNAFCFYIVMDVYLAARWFSLSTIGNDDAKHGNLLCGFAFVNWGITDTLELLTTTQFFEIHSGSAWDILWFTPYFLLALGLSKLTQEGNNTGRPDKNTPSMILRSSVLFTAIALGIHLLIQEKQFTVFLLASSQLSFFPLWIGSLLVLAIFEHVNLLRNSINAQQKVQKMLFESQAMRQRFEQQNKELMEQSENYHTILESTGNAIFTLDDSGKVLSVNRAGSLLLGYSKDELLGQDFSRLIKKGDELELLFIYQGFRYKLARQSNSLELESRLLAKDGTLLNVHATVSKHSRNANAPIIVSLTDIRQQKQVEQEVLRLKDQFTANMSHEFRTPLTIINGVLDNLLDKVSNNEIEQVQLAKNNSARMIQMVEQLLELSQAGQEALELQPVDAGTLISEIAKSFTTLAQHKQIDFTPPSPEPIWLLADQQALEKIIYNLLSNAFKYTPQHGKVSVLVQPEGQKVIIKIADTGIGISESDQDKIFQRFYRAKTANDSGIQGVGIGLSLVKELCQRMDWEISLSSKEGQGTQFTLCAPACDAHLDKIQAEPSAKTKYLPEPTIEPVDVSSLLTTPATTKSQYLVLVVEDNPDMQNHLEQIISPHHQCVIAGNGEEGLRMALDYIPDIIISDVMMSGMDGFDLLKAIKSNELTAYIPVIMLTARADNQSKLKGLRAEADDYLTKPFDANELLLRLSNQLKSRTKLQQKLTRQWHFSISKQDEQPAETNEEKFVLQLNAIFEAHYSDPDIPMSFIATKLAMSERQLQRKVKMLLGVSPLEALRQFRLERAKALLKQQKQVGFTAQACGFSSQSYFGRCFKDYVGMTPREYQKQQNQHK